MKALRAKNDTGSVEHDNIDFLRAFAGSSLSREPKECEVFLADIPGTSLSICISEEAVTSIAAYYSERERDEPSRPARVQAGLQHSKNEGRSVTGILFGRVDVDKRRTVTIGHLQPVALRPGSAGACGYSGPEQILSLAVAKSDHLAAVGMYALCDKSDAAPLQQGLALFARCFGHPDHVFVALNKSTSDRVFAQIFVRGDSKFLVNEPNLTLPIDQTGPENLKVPLAQGPDLPAGDPVSQLTIHAPAAPPASPGVLRDRKMLVVISLILLLAAAGSYEADRSRSSRDRTPKSAIVEPDRIGMRVERSGSDLQITWDKTSPLFAKATQALLQIRDGTYRKEIPISSEELKQGRILYIPGSNHVDVHMQVLTLNSDAVEESAKIVNGAVAEAADRPGTPDPLSRGESQVRNRAAAIVPKVSTPQRRPDDSQPGNRPVSSPALKKFVPPSVHLRVPEHAEALTPSMSPPQIPIQTNRLSANRNAPHLSMSAVLIPPPVQPPPASSPTASAGVQIPAPPSQVNEKERLGSTLGIPPSPRRQVPVIVPEYLKRRISSDISVDVRCSVDAKGHVSSVNVPATGVSLQGQLSVLAANAARQWTFSPARLHDQAVSSEYVITFHFRRTTGWP